jgi:hypothetical protein
MKVPVPPALEQTKSRAGTLEEEGSRRKKRAVSKEANLEEANLDEACLAEEASKKTT